MVSYKVMEEENAYELVDAKYITSLDKNPFYEVPSTLNQIKSVSKVAKSQQVKSELKKPILVVGYVIHLH